MESNASLFSLRASSSLAFRNRYMRRFLPLLSSVRERSAMRRFKAVKAAADFSLACAAGKTSWTKALCRRLFKRSKGKQRRSLGSLAHEAGLTLLNRLRRRRRIWAGAPPLRFRKSYFRVQRKHSKSKLQTIHRGKLEEDRASITPKMTTHYGNLEASKLSSLSELIPGGAYMDVPKLLDQTAHYIVSLQLQVDALSFLGQTLSTSKHL